MNPNVPPPQGSYYAPLPSPQLPQKPSRFLHWRAVGSFVFVALVSGAVLGGLTFASRVGSKTSPTPLPPISAATRQAIGSPVADSRTVLQVTQIISDEAIIKALKVIGDTALQANVTVTGKGVFGGSVTAANLLGNGSGVTNVNAALLGGQPASYYIGLASAQTQVGDGRLSDNVALRGAANTFSAANTFNGSFTVAGPASLTGGASISSLTLGAALPVASGGTGSTTAAGARTNLSAAQSGANSDITSLSGLTTALTVLQGGTGSTTAAGARTNLAAAQSGANSDITSLSGLTTALSVDQGGTGVATLAANGIVLGNGSAALTTVTASGTGLCLVSTAGAPAFATCPGVASVNGETGVLTLANASGAGGTITIDDANTSSKGIASFSATNFTVNSGAVDTVQGIATTSSPTFSSLNLSSALTVDSGGTGATTLATNGVVVGNGAAALTAITAASTGLCFMSTAGAPAFGACPGGVTSVNGQTAVLTVANATGAGGTITINDATTAAKGIASFNPANFTVTSGAVNTVQGIDTASTPTFAGLNLAAALAVGSGGTGATALASNGVVLGNGSGALTAVSAASAGLCFVSTAGAPTFSACPGGAGSGLTSLNGQTGIVSVANASGAGGIVTLDDATTAAKGIASFNPSNFSVASGAVNTIQGIATTSSPTFAGLSLTAALTVANGGTGTTTLASNGVILGNGINALSAVTAGGSGLCLMSTAGAPAFIACPGSSAVTSVDGQNGVLTVSNTTAAAGTITINDATTAAKGIASFNSTNFTVAGGIVNTAQNIDSASTPSFAGLNLASALTVANGGTGSTTAAGARTNLSAAQSGANSDITSITGLTTALTVLQGGTGSTTAAGARTNLSAAQSGANSDITSLSGLTTALTVLQGGTGSTTAAGARTNLSAAQSGANSDITSLSGLTTALSVDQGGTGAATLAANGIVLGNGSAALTTVTASGTGLCLVSTAGAPAFATCPGAGASVTSLNGQAGVLMLANATAAAGTITIDDATAATKGIASFDSTNFMVAAGDVNLVQDLDPTSTPTFAGLNLTSALSVASGGTGDTTAAGARTNLSAAQSGANSDITSLSGLTTALTVLQGGTGSTTAAGARTNLSAAESGANSDITSILGLTTALTVLQGGTGSTTAAGARTNLSAAESGANSDITSISGLTTALTVLQGGTGAATLASNGVVLGNGTGALSAVTAASAGLCLVSTAGAPAFAACPSAGGGVTSLNGQAGVLMLANASAAAGTITIDDATAATKGIASFDSTNFMVAAGDVNLVQDLDPTSTPTFAGLNLTGALTVANGGTGATTLATDGVVVGAGTGALTAVTAASAGLCFVSTAGTPTFSACPGGTGSGLTSLNGQTGIVSVANASGAGGIVTLDDATTAAKGIASFDSTNFTVTAGAVNTVQGIATTSTPTFAGLSLTAALTVANGGTGSTTAAGARTNLSAAQSGANSDITSISGLTTALTVLQGGTGSTTAAGARANLSAAQSGANSDITSITGLTTALTVLQGGTGATTAAAARTNLAAAKNGANSDITSITGLTTALTVLQGGTGATTAAGARTNLAAAKNGANSDITSISGLTTALTVLQGGTGSTTAAGARTNLSAAQSGANSDITSISGLTTALTVAQGGTGAVTLASNGVVLGAGVGALTAVTAGGSGLCFMSTAGAPAFAACPSGVTTVNGQTGVLTVANATGAAGTITINDATTAAKGIASFNSTNFSVASGAVNTVQGIATTSTPTFAGLNLTAALTVANGGTGSTTAAGARTNLSAAQSGANSDITSISGLTTALTVLQGGTGSTTAAGARTNLSAAQSGVNSDITSLSGLTTALTVLQGGTGATTAAAARTNLAAAKNGANSDITSITGLTTALTVAQGGTGATTLTANGVVLGNGVGALTVATAGGTGLCLLSTAGAPAFGACPGAGSVSSLNGLTGAITLANASGAGSTVTIDNATTAAKGIASFNATNFTVASGAVNTVQGISTAAAPTFAGLTITGNVLVKPASDSNTAFQIQNSVGATALNVSTTLGKVTVSQGALAVNGLSNPATPTLALTSVGGTLANATTYTYLLAATGPAGETQAIASSPVSTTTVNATSLNTITWSAVTNATGYKLYRSIDGGTTWFVNTLGAVTSAVDNGTNFTWATSPPGGFPAQFANDTGDIFMTAGAALVLDAGGNGTLKYNSASKTLSLANGAAGGAINLQAESFNIKDATSFNEFKIASAGAVTFQNRTNSAAGFQVQNAAGTALLVANTTSGYVQTGSGAITTTPSYLFTSDISNNAAGNAQLAGDWHGNFNWGIGANSNVLDNVLRIGITNAATWQTANNLNLLVAGTELIKPTTGNNSLTTLQVQNATGTTVLDVDTTNARVGIGTAAPGASLDISTGTIMGAGLSSDCSAQNSKLLWSSTTKQFSCGTDRASVSIRKTADTTVTSSTTLVNISDFSFSVGANEEWAFQVNATGSASLAGEYDFAMTAPAGSGCSLTDSDLADADTRTSTTCGNRVYGQTYSSGAVEGHLLYGVVKTSATAGTVQFKMSQHVSDATSTIMYADSVLMAYKLTGADLAEVYYTNDQSIQPGDIVAIDPSAPARVRKPTSPYDPTILGVVSTQPGQILSADTPPTGRPVMLALAGRIPVRVSTENGPIAPGDPLTSSSTPGVAMKATRPGQILGKALEGFADPDPHHIGMVMTFAGQSYSNAGEGTSVQGGAVSASTLTAAVADIAALNVSGTAKIKSLSVTGTAVIAELEVTGATRLAGTLTVNGHIITGGSVPTIAADASAACAGLDVTVDGNDTSGIIELTLPATACAMPDKLATLTFSTPYASVPRVTLTPANADAAGSKYYYDGASASAFDLKAAHALVPGKTYRYSYHVEQ